MQIIPFSNVAEEENRRKILEVVRQGGVLAYPTDTLYGLGGDFFSLAVHRRIDGLKGRSAGPYSAALGDLEMLTQLAASVPVLFSREFVKLLPGPYTFLFAASPRLNRRLLKANETVGIRLPNLPPLLALISASHVPWISTSVNRSDCPPLSDPERIARDFPGIDLLIDAGRLPKTAASTVVDLTTTPPRIVRGGAGLERVQDILGSMGAA